MHGDQAITMGITAQSQYASMWQFVRSLQSLPILASESGIINLRNDGRVWGILALWGGVLCWGVTPVILRRLTPFLDAWTANGIRYPLAAILYWPLLVVCFRHGQLTIGVVRQCLVPAFLAMSGQVFWSLAHYELLASEIGFLIRLSMVWSIVGSMVMFRDERRLLSRPGFHVGVVLIVGGFLVMTWSSGHRPTSDVVHAGNHTLGVIWILLCGLSFGLYMVSVRSCLSRMDPLLAFGIVAQIVSLGLVVGMVFGGDVTAIGRQSGFAWMLIIASSLLGIAFGHILMYAAVHRLGTAITSSCQTLMPFITATVASVTLSETLIARQWLGGIVIVLGAMTLLSLKNVIEPPDSDSRAVES